MIPFSLPAVIHHRKGPDRNPLHQQQGIFQGMGGGDGDRIPGHDVPDLKLCQPLLFSPAFFFSQDEHIGGQSAPDVTISNNAHQRVVFLDHRKMVDAVLFHLFPGFQNAGIGFNGNNVPGHGFVDEHVILRCREEVETYFFGLWAPSRIST